MKHYFVYVLRSRLDKWVYVGYTTNFRERLIRHNSGHVTSTKIHKPYELIFLEVYIDMKDAKRREKYLKTTKGKTTLRCMLFHTLE